MLIYCIHNTVNGKSYVGQTRQTLAARWKAHRAEALKRNSPRYLCRAIRKYGVQSFDVFPLACASSQEQLNALERLWIAVLGAAAGINGYNRTHGAEAGMNEAARKQMAETKRGTHLYQSHKDKIAAAVTGTHWTPEARQGWKGHTKTEATREKISVSKTGKKLSVQHREALKCSHKATPALLAHIAALAVARKGNKFSEEVRKNMRAAQKARFTNGSNS